MDSSYRIRKEVSMIHRDVPYDAEIEYLQNPVGGFIRLPYKPSNNTGYEIRWCKADTQSIERVPLGCWHVWNNTMWGDDFKEQSTQILCCWGNSYKSISSNTYPATNFVIWKRVNDKFYYNGSNVVTNTSYTFQSNNDIFLFGLNINNVNPIYNKPIKIAYCKIFDSTTNELFFDLIPVRKGTTGYMYDKISGQLFGNAGTGSFVLGPDVAPGRYANEVAFLESWGNQYIDTGIKPSTDTKIELKCLYCKSGAGLTSYGSLIGADDRDNAYILNHSAVANFTYGLEFSNNFANPQTRLLTFDSTASPQNMRVYDEGGSLVTTLTCLRGVFEVNQNLYLFAVNRGGTPVYGSNRILYCKIYDGDTLVRDYVPVEYNGVGYMYDKVSGLFFNNQGTGKFLFGSIAKACARSYTRRQLMADIVAPKPYISNGMVFHLDGRDYDHETKTWEDRIRGLVFSMTGTSISQDGLGVYFNGNAYSTLSNWFGTNMSSCTLEVVYNKTGANASVCAAGTGGWTQYRRVGNNVWRKTGSSVAICPNDYGMVTHSLTDAINIFNGRSLGYQSGGTYYNRGTNTNFYIGRDNNNQYRMVGNIYQIRIYNRRLSLDEIAYNQEQDRKRYGIQF